MALTNDIRALRDRSLAELIAAHDYYVDTRVAWHLVRRAIKASRPFVIRNVITGTVTSQDDLAGRARDYVAEQLAEATFQQFVAMFENFFFDFLRLWLVAYPRSLSGKQVDFKAILDAPDKDAIKLHVVNRELNEIAYERPTDWFAYLETRARLGCPTVEEIDRLAEAKASRDILAHNRGVANRVYESKAGRLARYHDGEKIEVSQRYHRETWEMIRKVVRDVSDAALVKVQGS
jgi:hypothetical protein